MLAAAQLPSRITALYTALLVRYQKLDPLQKFLADWLD